METLDESSSEPSDPEEPSVWIEPAGLPRFLITYGLLSFAWFLPYEKLIFPSLSNSKVITVLPMVKGLSFALFAGLFYVYRYTSAQAQLRFSRAAARRMKTMRDQLVENAPDAVLTVDESGTVVEANPAAEAIFGVEAEKMIGSDLAPAALLNADPRDVGGPMSEDSGSVRRFETLVHRADGSEFPAQLSVFPTLWSGRKSHTGFIRDLSALKRMQEQIAHQNERMYACHQIDLAITGSHNLRHTWNDILHEVRSQLQVDAVDLLLYHPPSESLTFAASQGFRKPRLARASLPILKGAGEIPFSNRRRVHIPDLRLEKEIFAREELIEKEGFVAYYGTPLIFEGELQGVLELFHRSPHVPDMEWSGFLEISATQLAIAVDRAHLAEELQQTSIELSLAYDRTLEGWVRALDLRDQETHGHTQRVTEMTLRLAMAMGVEDDGLTQYKRGALLHDIGKIGIPDRVLLKPGALSEDERRLMEMHTVYAHEFLSLIDFLQPALDIPYCHHERWDGTGYPRGLRQEEIPLSARIFSVVDVWDALLSDRPYRQRWAPGKVMRYIPQMSGKQFDPLVVDAFIQLLHQDKGAMSRAYPYAEPLIPPANEPGYNSGPLPS